MLSKFLRYFVKILVAWRWELQLISRQDMYWHLAFLCSMFQIIYDLTEQETEAGDGVPGEEVPCVTAHVEVFSLKCSISVEHIWKNL